MNFSKFLERVLQLVPVLLGVSVIVFLMMAVTPGDPVEIMLGDQQATPEQRQALREDMGLDLPLPQRFGHFLKTPSAVTSVSPISIAVRWRRSSSNAFRRRSS